MATPELKFKLAIDGGKVVGAEIDGVAYSLERLDGQARKAAAGSSTLKSELAGLSGFDSMVGSITQRLGGLAAGFSVVQAASKLISVQREFDVLNSSLITVTGSSANAAREFAWIKQFAATTPYQLNEVTGAFVKMKALGMDASQQALSSYGNTASAMGKGLNQMIEAVADAATGEFERLKEFGIKAKQNGDQVSLTFKGVTTTIGNSANDITRYLQQIGDVDFAGAMNQRAATLDGSISNLADTWDQLFRTINESGINKAIQSDVQTTSSLLQGLSDTMEATRKAGGGMGMELANTAGFVVGKAAIGTLNSTASALNWTVNGLTANVFKFNENVRVLPESLMTAAQKSENLAAKLKTAEEEFARLNVGSNLTPGNFLDLATYRAKLLVDELRKAKLANDQLASGPSALPATGAGAGRGTVSQLDYQKKLSDAMAQYADKTEKADKAVEALRKTHGALFTPEMEKKVRDQMNPPKATGGVPGVSDAAKGLKEYNDLIAKSAGFNADFSEQWGVLSAAYQGGKINVEQLALAQAGLLAQQPAIKASHDAQAKAIEIVTKYQAEAIKQSLAYYDTLAKGLSSQQDSNDKLREQVEEIGLTTNALGSLRLARLDATIAQEQEIMTMAGAHEASAGELLMMQKRIDLLKEQRNLTSTSQTKTAADEIVKAQQKSYADMWASVDSTAHDVFVNVADEGMDAFKRIGKTLKSAVLDMLYQMTVKKWIFAISGSTSGGLASAAGGADGGAMGALTAISNGNTALNLYSSGLAGIGGNIAALGNTFGSTAVSAFGAGLASSSAMGPAVLAYTEAAAATAAGNAALAATYTTTATGLSAGAAAGTGATSALAAIPVYGWIAMAVVAVASIFGGRGDVEAKGKGIEGKFDGNGFKGNSFAQFEQDGGWFHSDRSWEQDGALGASTTQALTVGFGSLQLSAAGLATSLGLSTDAIQNYSEDIRIQLTDDAAENQKIITEMLSGIGDRMATAVAPGLAALAKDGETASATLGRLSGSITTANSWLSVLRQRLFQVSMAGGDAASKLADAFGGLENLTTASQAFYDSYYSEGEKVATSQQHMTAALAAFGLALPGTKDELRALAGTLDLSTDSGRKAYATLLALAPEYSNTADAAARMAKDAADAASKMAQDTSAALMKAFTGNGALAPALEVSALKVEALTGGLANLSGWSNNASGSLGGTAWHLMDLMGWANNASGGVNGTVNNLANLYGWSNNASGSLGGTAWHLMDLMGWANNASGGVNGTVNNLANLYGWSNNASGALSGSAWHLMDLMNWSNNASGGVNGTVNNLANLYGWSNNASGALAGSAWHLMDLMNWSNNASGGVNGTVNNLANLYGWSNNASGALSGSAWHLMDLMNWSNNASGGVNGTVNNLANLYGWSNNVSGALSGSAWQLMNLHGWAGNASGALGNTAGTLSSVGWWANSTSGALGGTAGNLANLMGWSDNASRAVGDTAWHMANVMNWANNASGALWGTAAAAQGASSYLFLGANPSLVLLGQNSSVLSGVLDVTSGSVTTVAGRLLGAQYGIAAVNGELIAFGSTTSATSGSISYINAVMGNANSGVLTLSNGVNTLAGTYTGAQLAGLLLNNEIDGLRYKADAARIDFAGLGAALVNVNTETFVTTLAAVFENLASRIGDVISDIGTERIAVRDAALSIVNPTVMSKAAIQRGIAGINTALPGSDAMQSAAGALASADSAVATANAAKASASSSVASATWLVANNKALMQQDATRYQGLGAQFRQMATAYGTSVNQSGSGVWANDAYSYNASNNRLSDWGSMAAAGNYAQFRVDARGGGTGDGTPESLVYQLANANAALAQDEQAIVNAQAALNVAGVQLAATAAALSTTLAQQAVAEANAKASALAYAAALQDFAIDAGKSVGKLTRLREETVRYYEAQRALADLMTTSAAGIRSTISAYTFSQKSDEQKFQDLAGQFSTAYTLSKVTTGETLAGYGDKINALINPMIEALQATGRESLIASYLAQAEAVAVSVDSGVLSLGDYQADSLGMLGSIDATLAALDASSQSAEKIISDAVRAGSEKTAAGLHAVIAALTGQAIPAFASGGYHSGGLRLVGENGPELEVTGPSRIYNASQTRGMFAGGGGGNTERLEALVERQARQLENMSYELRSIASSNARLAKIAERDQQDGVLVRTDADQPLDVAA